jgi:hypothetical protein
VSFTSATPVIEMLVTLSTAREVTLPSTVSSKLAPLRRSVIVCALAPAMVVAHATGGERPGPGVAAGSGGGGVTAPVELDVELSDWALGVVALVAPVVPPPDDVPAPPGAPLTSSDCCVSPG